MRRASILLGLLNFSYWFANGMLMPLIPSYALHLGASAVLVTVILATQTLPSFVMAIPIGAAVDRFGGKYIVFFGSLLAAIAVSILLLPGTPALLLLSQALSGLGFMSIWIGVQSWMIAPAVDGTDRTEVNKRIANVSFAGIGGQLLGPLIGGGIASAWGFPLAFAVVLLSLVGCPFLGRALGRAFDRAAAARESGERKAFHVEVRASYRNSWRMLWEPGVLLTMSVSFCALFLIAAQTGIWPTYFASNGVDVSVIGAIASVSGGFSLLSRFLILPFLHRFRRGTAVLLVIIPGAIAVNAIFLFDHVVIYFTLGACAGLVLGAAQPLSISLIADFTDEESRGLGVGLRMVANRAAQSFSPMIFGVMISLAGFSMAFSVSALLMGSVGAIVAIRLNRLSRPNTS